MISLKKQGGEKAPLHIAAVFECPSTHITDLLFFYNIYRNEQWNTKKIRN